MAPPLSCACHVTVHPSSWLGGHASDVGEGHVTLALSLSLFLVCGLIFFLPGACQAHLEYRATFFGCSSSSSRYLSCGSDNDGVRLVCQCSDDTHLVFHRLVTLELQVLINVSRLSVHTQLEWPIRHSGRQGVEHGECTLVCWAFRCCMNGSMFAVLITASASTMCRPQYLGGSWYAPNALPS